MKSIQENMVTLHVHSDISILPVCTSFVENAARVFGLAQKEVLALTLAAEEILSYLFQKTPSGKTFEISCFGGGYYVRVDFSFSTKDFDEHAFNLTARVSPEDDESLKEMGLLIASRLVDHLQHPVVPGEGFRLSVIKEKTYPPLEDAPPIKVHAMDEYDLKKPGAEELKLFVRLLNENCTSSPLPQWLRFPGKVVDMVKSGEYQAAIATGNTGQLGGGILWHGVGTKIIECFGPYLFGQDTESPMATDLLETCIGAVAKTQAVGIVNRFSTDDFPPAHFEILGALTVSHMDGSRAPRTAYFRLMHEDPGSSVWAHPDLLGFLEKEYSRLVLPREILPAGNQGESQNPHSVLVAEYDRGLEQVVLRPLRPGLDAEQNLDDHLTLFKSENIPNIYFAMDLGQPWQAQFTPSLLKAGLTPQLILPYGIDGDVVIFQLPGGSQ
ncbi:hypothetical protein ACFL4N_06590 [Thermodesulfobacteriota bacterium]